MNSEYQIRFNDIREGPWHELSLLARQQLPTFDKDKADRYLRFHGDDENGITDINEIKFRESFDQALEELQLIELAVASGYLRLEDVKDHVLTEFGHLFAQQAARSYMLAYDYVPVRFLATRLNVDLGQGEITPPAVNPKAGVRYATFLALHSDFISSQPIESFTMLLDDYRFKGLIDAAFFRQHFAAGSPLLIDDRAQKFQELQLGFAEFVNLLGDLFLQLNENEVPLYGCMYAYWLSHFFGIRRTRHGYKDKGVSFDDMNLSATESPSGIETAERKRLMERMRLLRDVWKRTRGLIESLDLSVSA